MSDGTLKHKQNYLLKVHILGSIKFLILTKYLNYYLFTAENMLCLLFNVYMSVIAFSESETKIIQKWNYQSINNLFIKLTFVYLIPRIND